MIMKPDRNKLLKMLLILALICILAGALTKLARQNSMTLADYARQNPDIAYQKQPPQAPVSGSDVRPDAKADPKTTGR